MREPKSQADPQPAEGLGRVNLQNEDLPMRRIEKRALLYGDGPQFLQGIATEIGVPLTPEINQRLAQLWERHFNKVSALLNERAFPFTIESLPHPPLYDRLTNWVNSALAGNSDLAFVVLDKTVHEIAAAGLKPGMSKRIAYAGFGLERLIKEEHEDPALLLQHLRAEAVSSDVTRLQSQLHGKSVGIISHIDRTEPSTIFLRNFLQELGLTVSSRAADHLRIIGDESSPNLSDSETFLVSMKGPYPRAPQRGYTVFDGPISGQSKSFAIAAHRPDFLPFGSGATLGLKHRLELPEISKQILTINLEMVKELEEILGRKIFLLDLPRRLPLDSAVPGSSSEWDSHPIISSARKEVVDRVKMVRPFVSAYLEEKMPEKAAILPGMRFRTFLRDTGLSELIDFAREYIARIPAPFKKVVACDIDGVMATLRREDGDTHGAGFHGSLLGASVRMNQINLLCKLSGASAEEAAETVDKVGPEWAISFFMKEFGKEIEKQFGEKAAARITKIYEETLGPALGIDEARSQAQKFLKSMPLSYHAYRVETWDHDMERLYERNPYAAHFSREIVDRGGVLVYVTAAPRIHALKTLRHVHVLEQLGPGDFELYSVEDTYPSDTVAWDLDNPPADFYREGDKGTLISGKVVRDLGTSIDEVCMGGDQLKSDVLKPQKAGIDSILIPGLEGLRRYASSITLPRDLSNQ
ncbi:MAG: hypothetical protein J5J00_07720 [Deltaproteobacteria bacterium]|nr:hypothetical protein [Deltaproteobacteria bacterium]